MTTTEILKLIKNTDRYNFHSHTEFCDGRAPMSVMAAAAAEDGFRIWGFTPHSPLSQPEPCNMKFEDVDSYINEASRLKESYSGETQILTSMEIDFMGSEFGPHIDYFQNLPLDYRLASVHFVPNQDGIFLDCDGNFDRFSQYLKDGYRGDLRYVTEKYFEHVIRMMEYGGIEILGHFDKIAGNAAMADPEIENNSWYEALVDDVISHAKSAGIIMEINTKAIYDKGRFFPALRWWKKVMDAEIPVVINSDAHHPDKVNTGRDEALTQISKLMKK